MPSGYYSDTSGAKQALPVNAHSHTLDRTQFSNIGLSNDGSVTDPKPGQGIYWVGNPPTDANPGQFFAGDAPTKAPVNETVLANWFEPTSWNPPGVDNPDGAAGTWRPIDPISTQPGSIFTWLQPESFGVASETVDGYIRLQTTSDLVVEWGREINSGARPIAYGAAGTQSAGEYVYKITVLAMALEAKTGATGPWKISVGLAFYRNNVIRDGTNAPLPSLSKEIVWGVNQYDLLTDQESEQWTAVECYMNGRVPVSDIPSDAPIGGTKGWRDTDPDGPEDGYYFAPVIKVSGADADILIDSVQVFRGQNNLLVPGGVITTNVTTDSLQINQRLSAPSLELTATPDSDIALLPNSVVSEGDEFGNTTWFTAFNTTYTNQIPSVVNNQVQISWKSDAPNSQLLSQGIPPDKHGLTFEPGVEYVFTASVQNTVGTSITEWGLSVYTGEPGTPGGTVVVQGTRVAPETDGSSQNYEFRWTPDTQHVDTYVCIDAVASSWSTPGESTTLLQFGIGYVGDAPGTIIGLGDPVEPSDPVTLGYLTDVSEEFGGGTTNIVHSPNDTQPEPPENPNEPFEDGTLWANPGAVISPPTTWFFSPGTAEVSAPGTSSWSPVPNYDRMEFTAPGPGVLQIVMSVRVKVNQQHLYLEVKEEDGSDHYKALRYAIIADMDPGGTTQYSHQTMTETYLWAYDRPGTSIFFANFYSHALVDGFPKINQMRWYCTWFPNMVMLDAENPGGSDASTIYAPFARVRSGNTWAPEGALRLPGRQALDPTVTVVNVATNSSISGGGTQNGGSRTLTGTVSSSSGTPVGSIRFKKNGSTFSTKTLSGGKATVSVSTSGSYSIEYLGGQSGANNYQPSSSGSTSVTIRSLQTKSVRRTLKWRGQYPQSNGYVQSDYYSHWIRQGRYSGTWGNWKTLLGIDGVGGVSNLNDATKVTFTLRLDHTYYGGGADLDIGWHTRSSRPGTYTVGSGQENQGGYYRSTGTHTIDISSWAKGRVTRSDFGGIAIGSGSSGNLNHYCYGSNTAHLDITYRQWV